MLSGREVRVGLLFELRLGLGGSDQRLVGGGLVKEGVFRVRVRQP